MDRAFSITEEGSEVKKSSNLTNTIRRLRFDFDEMTQRALADRVGVTRQTVIAIERGKYSPSLEVAFRIAHVFGMPLEEVFKFEPEQQETP